MSMLEAGKALPAQLPNAPPLPAPVSRRTAAAPGPNSLGRGHKDSACAPLAAVWREVQGADYWNNMLSPAVHPVLRSEVVRYGELVKACYEAFEFEPRTRPYGRCKYGRRRLLGEVGMADCGYEVTKYIYATPDISLLPGPLKQEGNQCSWMGFVAVAQREEELRRLGRRDICVALRGTVTPAEWLANLVDIPAPARLDPDNPRREVKVELGFLSLYTSDDAAASPFSDLGSAREQLLGEIGRLVREYEDEELSITLTGHSMGGALALLCAYDVAEVGLNRRSYVPDHRLPVPTTVFSFGGPRVGNAAFKRRCDELGVRILRVVNAGDVVTNLPGAIFNENCHFLERYSHVGVELALGRPRGSSASDLFASEWWDLCPSFLHQLETYLERLESNNAAKGPDSQEDAGPLAVIRQPLRRLGKLLRSSMKTARIPILNGGSHGTDASRG